MPVVFRLFDPALGTHLCTSNSIEAAYAQPFRSCDERNDAMHAWITAYNHSTPHSALGGRSPIQRIARDNLLGKDS